MEEKNKISRFELRTSASDRQNIARLANRLHVSESDAVRIAVSELLQSGKVPNIPVRMRRPLVIRRKAGA